MINMKTLIKLPVSWYATLINHLTLTWLCLLELYVFVPDIQITKVAIFVIVVFVVLGKWLNEDKFYTHPSRLHSKNLRDSLDNLHELNKSVKSISYACIAVMMYLWQTGHLSKSVAIVLLLVTAVISDRIRLQFTEGVILEYDYIKEKYSRVARIYFNELVIAKVVFILTTIYSMVISQDGLRIATLEGYTQFFKGGALVLNLACTIYSLIFVSFRTYGDKDENELISRMLIGCLFVQWFSILVLAGFIYSIAQAIFLISILLLLSVPKTPTIVTSVFRLYNSRTLQDKP